MQCYPDGAMPTSVGGTFRAQLRRRLHPAFWFNHLVQSFSHSDTGKPDCRAGQNRHARDVGASSTPRLIDSIAAVSGMPDRPVKPGDDNRICIRTLVVRWPLALRSGHGLNRLAVDAGLALQI